MYCPKLDARRLATGLALMLLAGCTGFGAHRMGLDADCRLPPADPARPSRACEQAALERVDGSGDVPAFEVAYVEFTDQGWLHSRTQMNQALRQVMPRAGDSRPVQLVVFVHGWKHSAAHDDENVINFRRLILPPFARSAGPSTRTIGLYVGWRGKSVDLPVAREVTFYDRKSTAEHVARGSIRELIARIRLLNARGRADGSLRVALIGHSFGGLIVFNAMAESLLDELVRAQGTADARPLLDLAVVVNPAFEASRFEPLFQVAKLQPAVGAPRPLFVSITARNDSATRTWFPAGRTVNSLFDHEGWTDEDICPGGFAPSGECPSFDRSLRLEKRANTNTMGHLDRYATHDLSRDPGGPVRCSPVAEVAPTADPAPGTAPALRPQAPEPRNRFPLWTMRAAADVVDGHSGIYEPELWTFLTRLASGRATPDQLCPPGAGR
ncbi:MAG: hypothetical protein U1F56_01645 [Rubrivivax sp.]